MDRVEIQDQNFALTSDSLRLMQQAWESLQQLAMLGAVSASGSADYILSGCEQTGNVVASGVVVLNGEMLPFAGGAANTYISAGEQSTVVTVGSGSYTKIERIAQWGTGANQREWASLRNKRPSPKCYQEMIELPIDSFVAGDPAVTFYLNDYLPGDFTGVAIFDCRVTWLLNVGGTSVSITPPNNNRDTAPSSPGNFSGVTFATDSVFGGDRFSVWSPIYIGYQTSDIIGLILQFSRV